MMMLLGCGSSGAGGPPPNSAEAQSYFDRMIPGVTALSDRETALAAFIDGMQAAGLNGDVFDRFYVMIQPNEVCALTDLWHTGNDYQAVPYFFTGTGTFTVNRGFVTTSTWGMHLNTRFNPATASSPKYTLNDACVGHVNFNNSTITAYSVLAATVASPTVPITTLGLAPKWSGTAYAAVNSAEIGGAYSGSSAGLWIAQRTPASPGPAQLEVYRNNSAVFTNATAATSVPNGYIRFYPLWGMSLAFVGKSLDSTQRGNLQTLVEALSTALTGGFP